MCISPITLKPQTVGWTPDQLKTLKQNGIKTKPTTVPCGTCNECKARRISGWSFRLQKEMLRHNSAHFVTLTYDSPPLTENNYMNLHKPHLQNFFKYLRKNNQKIKYYACGEYGTQTMRPHYHLIIFGTTPEYITALWTHGHVHFGQVTGASIGYTLKYMCKTSKIPLHQNDDRLPEFALMSKKLGDNYLTPQMINWHQADLKNRCYATINEIKLALPRYYKDKIYSLVDKQIIAKHMENIANLQLLEHVDISLKTKRDIYEKQDLIRTHKGKTRNTRLNEKL